MTWNLSLGLMKTKLISWTDKGFKTMMHLANQSRPLEPSQQCYWLAGLTLAASLTWGIQEAIEDEAFLMFLADSVIDEDSEDGLTDPLHMIEQDLVESNHNTAQNHEDESNIKQQQEAEK